MRPAGRRASPVAWNRYLHRLVSRLGGCLSGLPVGARRILVWRTGLGGKAAESQRRVAKWLRTTVARERGLEQRAAGELRLAHVAGSCASRASLPVDRLVSAARLFDVRDVVRPTTTQPGSVAPLGSSSAPGPAHLAPHRWARKGTGTPRVSISNSGLRVRTHGQSNSSLILSLLVALGVLLLLAALGSKLRSPDSRQARAGSPSAGAAFGPALSRSPADAPSATAPAPVRAEARNPHDHPRARAVRGSHRRTASRPPAGGWTGRDRCCGQAGPVARAGRSQRRNRCVPACRRTG